MHETNESQFCLERIAKNSHVLDDDFNGTVNFLKIRTLYSVLFWLKFCFLCSSFLKYLVEWQTV